MYARSDSEHIAAPAAYGDSQSGRKKSAVYARSDSEHIAAPAAYGDSQSGRHKKKEKKLLTDATKARRSPPSLGRSRAFRIGS